MAKAPPKTEEKMELNLTSMIDVSFLILIFFMCLPFKTLEGKLQAFLPTDKGLQATVQAPKKEYKISIHLYGRNEKKHLWNNQEVMMPTTIWYRFGDNETRDINTVYEWIRKFKANAQPGQETVGEINALYRVPHCYVVAVLNQFARAKVEKVNFFGAVKATPQQRKMIPLPWPARSMASGG